MISYVPKKNRNVLLLSFEFYDTAIEKEKMRPQIIMHYIVTKGALDNGDRLTKLYTCSKSTRRWPFHLFMELLDISALNSYVIWKTKFPGWRSNAPIRRQYFLRELAIQLVTANVFIR